MKGKYSKISELSSFVDTPFISTSNQRISSFQMRPYRVGIQLSEDLACDNMFRVLITKEAGQL